MHIRLDPPELGAIHVHVEVRDGIMNASFETDNDQTVQLLSHSLGSLKTALEAQGMTIEKLHVHQSPRQQPAAGERRQSDSDHAQDHAARQEQQRKEVMRRMWRKLMKGQDPLDLVA
jgi:flagellar hook-length control protein FliK